MDKARADRLAPDLLPQSQVVAVLLLLLLCVLVGLLVSERGVTEAQGEDDEGDTKTDTDDCGSAEGHRGMLYSLPRMYWTAMYDSTIASRSGVPHG